MVERGVGIWIWDVNARGVGIKGAPVDDFPMSFYFETSIWHYHKRIVSERGGQQLAVGPKKLRFSVNPGTVAFRDHFVIGKFDEKVRAVVYHDLLRTSAAFANAIERSESTYDGTFITRSIE